MAKREKLLTELGLEHIERTIWEGLPDNPTFEYFLECRKLVLLSAISKCLGLNAFVIRRYAKAKKGRLKKMGMFIIGDKFYVNSYDFSRWTLSHPPTRRRIMLHVMDDLAAPPRDGTLEKIIETGKTYLLDDLCSVKIIPKPFRTPSGKETLYNHAKRAEDPRNEVGLFFNETFKTWLVDPIPFFRHLGHHYHLLD